MLILSAFRIDSGDVDGGVDGDGGGDGVDGGGDDVDGDGDAVEDIVEVPRSPERSGEHVAEAEQGGFGRGSMEYAG